MRLLLLDLDGTIRQPASGATFINDPLDQEIIPGAREAIEREIARYPDEVIYICGVTNQGGVAAGKKSLTDCIAEQRRTLELCPLIDWIFFCPDFEGELLYEILPLMPVAEISNFDFIRHLKGFHRKPESGMLLAAIERTRHFTDDELTGTLMVGDRSEDREAAANAGICFIDAVDWRNH